jgi:hypothetical protein
MFCTNSSPIRIPKRVSSKAPSVSSEEIHMGKIVNEGKGRQQKTDGKRVNSSVMENSWQKEVIGSIWL